MFFSKKNDKTIQNTTKKINFRSKKRKKYLFEVDNSINIFDHEKK